MSLSLGLGAFLGSAVSSAANVVGGLQANAQNAKENQKNRDWNEKMWNLNNQYNLPQNQMMRLKSAGLNPNLVYGQGTSTLSSYAGNLGANQRMENPAKGINLDVASAAAMSLQQKQTDANIDLMEHQANESYTRAVGNTIENHYKGAIRAEELRKLGLEADAQDIENTVMGSPSVINDRIAAFSAELARAVADGEIKKEQIGVVQQEFLNKIKEGTLLEAQTKQVNSNSELMSSQAAYYREMAKNAPFERRLLRAQTREALAKTFEAISGGELNKEQAYKVAVEAEEAYYNGAMDRYIKYFQRYDQSPIAISMSSAAESNPYNLESGTPKIYHKPPKRGKRTIKK